MMHAAMMIIHQRVSYLLLRRYTGNEIEESVVPHTNQQISLYPLGSVHHQTCSTTFHMRINKRNAARPRVNNQSDLNQRPSHAAPSSEIMTPHTTCPTCSWFNINVGLVALLHRYRHATQLKLGSQAVEPHEVHSGGRQWSKQSDPLELQQ